jgi:catecholate siderophore receptor
MSPCVWRLRCSLAASLTLLLSLPIHAQSPPLAVTGVVVDTSGGAVRGATVTLRDASGATRETVSDAVGRFLFDAVPPAGATVTVLIRQFAPMTVAVLSSAAADLRIVLQPLALTEVLTVHAPSPNSTRITSATKTSTPLSDVPQAVTAISRDVIGDQQMRSMADVARYMPGVGFAQGEGNRDAPIFRGNTSTSDFFVDGVRDDVQYFRDLYNVERVEALKGPSAMIFGRGGMGGVINRVVRQAEWIPMREAGLQVGSFDSRRFTADVGNAINRRVAARVTAMYEDAGSYRQGVGLERYGLNPTLAFSLGTATTVRVGYEHFHDNRTADRGIPSFAGAPVVTNASTFFGNADQSSSVATVNVLTSAIEHRFGDRLTVRNRLLYGDYDKFYQNVFPGLVDADTTVSVSAYKNLSDRRNLFSQTDLLLSHRTGRIAHSIVAGVEFGRQVTDNFRATGYFTSLGPTTTSVKVPTANPSTSLPIEFRQSASDADNHGVARVAAVYAQDQMALTRRVQAVLGLRYESFSMDFRNNRNGMDVSSIDGLLSPRLGLIYKPVERLSLYTSYALTHLPRAGEQLSSLSLSTASLDPEESRNYEVGAKWDIGSTLSFTAAAYRSDRGNVSVPDPVNPAVSLLVDAQKTTGVELGLAGRFTSAWSVVGAYAHQNGEITRSISATAQAGASLAQLPANSFSLWNKYDVSRVWGVGLALIHRAAIFTSTDNSVTLPGFTRADGALFCNMSQRVRAQLNVENLFDAHYYASAHSNTNIMPGSPRAVRLSLTMQF